MFAPTVNLEMRQTLINTYLDYTNNYLTIAKYAEHNGLTEQQVLTVIALGRALNESKHPEG